SKSNNEFLRKNTARLVLEGTVYGAGSQSCIGLSDTFITAPDGISRQALSSIGCVSEGTVKTVIVSFEIDEPIAGTYEIGFVPSHDTTSETYTFEVVVP